MLVEDIFDFLILISGPPKALDEDETEFLDNLETVSMVLKAIRSLGMPASVDHKAFPRFPSL